MTPKIRLYKVTRLKCKSCARVKIVVKKEWPKKIGHHLWMFPYVIFDTTYANSWIRETTNLGMPWTTQ